MTVDVPSVLRKMRASSVTKKDFDELMARLERTEQIKREIRKEQKKK
jgi:hypothetical protein